MVPIHQTRPKTVIIQMIIKGKLKLHNRQNQRLKNWHHRKIVIHYYATNCKYLKFNSIQLNKIHNNYDITLYICIKKKIKLYKHKILHHTFNLFLPWIGFLRFDFSIHYHFSLQKKYFFGCNLLFTLNNSFLLFL